MNDVAAKSVSIAPWLSVGDAQQAIEFYQAAFGAVVQDRLEDDGEVQVAHLAIGDADFWVQLDPDISPADGPRPVRMIVSVADPDPLFSQALSAGATEVSPMAEEHGWRTGRLADPFGHHWEISRPTDD